MKNRKTGKGFFDRVLRILQNFLPSPFTLAVILTLVSMVLALVLTSPKPGNSEPHFLQIIDFWQGGFWSLLEFAMQMMLMLVLGHVLALSKPFNSLIQLSLGFVKGPASAAFVVTLLTVLMGLFNWGLGLIFGAILARKVGEYAQKKMIPVNYPLIGAAGYSALLVWHGGFSGSAPLKVAEAGHQFIAQTGGEPIPASETIFGAMNLVIAACLIVIIPLAMFFLARVAKGKVPQLKGIKSAQKLDAGQPETPAERLDYSRWISLLFGGIMLVALIYIPLIKPEEFSWKFLQPNYINLLLLCLGLLLHPHFAGFIRAVEAAIRGSAGIMIQFPLYAGILGILAGSGLIDMVSDFFVEVSGPTSFPVLTFFSAGLVNFFVPSGGGQWAVQGGIVLQAATELGVAQPKAIMALCYGDQITNMLQPFWALPLLGITGLKARQILPYTAFMMVVASIIFITGLLLG